MSTATSVWTVVSTNANVPYLHNLRQPFASEVDALREAKRLSQNNETGVIVVYPDGDTVQL